MARHRRIVGHFLAKVRIGGSQLENFLQDVASPEESLVATCLHHLSSTSSTAVILLTADPTLSNIALANGVRVATAATIRQRLLGEDVKEPAPAVVRETEEMAALARTALGEVLEAVLVAELQEVHGAQLWRQVVGLGAEDRCGHVSYYWLPRPPYWELGALARQFLRHHTAAILPAFPRTASRLRRVVDRLLGPDEGGGLVGAVREVVEVAAARGWDWRDTRKLGEGVEEERGEEAGRE